MTFEFTRPKQTSRRISVGDIVTFTREAISDMKPVPVDPRNSRDMIQLLPAPSDHPRARFRVSAIETREMFDGYRGPAPYRVRLEGESYSWPSDSFRVLER
jgi:hypothetical protein